MTGRQAAWAFSWRILLAAGMVAAFMLLTGCNSVHGPSERPHADALVWSRDIAFAEQLWRPEVEARFGDCLIVVCHGGYRNGVWCLVPDAPRPPMPVESVAWTLAETYRKPVVLISCNPEAHRLKSHPPGVWYALKNVSVAPGYGLPCCAIDLGEFTN